MKKIYTWAAALITIIASSFALSSCDTDYFQASTLDGEWRGDFGMYYIDVYGRAWDASYSIIEFYQNGFSSRGWGKQYDYYAYGPMEWEYNEFQWEIRDGIIYLNYPQARELNTSIYNYSMNSHYFSGYFSNTHNYFRLQKYSDWSWNGYSNSYYYYNRPNYYYDGYYYGGGYYGGYYSKSRTAVTDSTAVEAPHQQTNFVVKHGNHNNDVK